MMEGLVLDETRRLAVITQGIKKGFYRAHPQAGQSFRNVSSQGQG